MKDIERFQTDARMSQAVVYAGTVYLAGQVDLVKTAPEVGGQMQRILQHIDELLQQAGSDRTRLLSATIWLADMVDFAEMNRAWMAWIPEGCAPARATVQAGLAFPALRVEVAVVAAVGTAKAPGSR